MFSQSVVQSSNPLARLGRAFRPTFSYWMETEVHVYGFSIAANVLLSFFPFLIVILSVCRYVLGWDAAAEAVKVALSDFFPGSEQPGEIGYFVARNLEFAVRSRRTFQMLSILLLLYTANGIFEPLEVALNRAWGITKNRSFLKNQIISFALIFTCGSLALTSTVLTGMNARLIGGAGDPFSTFLELAFYKMAAVPVSILSLFLIYWLLPNARIPARLVLPPAIFVGLGLEVLKYVNILTWPLLREKLRNEYGPFYYSVTIILWSFLGAMLLLAGAEWAARRGLKRAETDAPADGPAAPAEPVPIA